jgi:hypothetical protein
MSDIVERLRKRADVYLESRGNEPHYFGFDAALDREAADEIERLREEISTLQTYVEGAVPNDEAGVDNLLQKTADASAKIARLLALDEAARFIEANCECDAIWHAKQIRALKGGE